ncbi:hypothetical protein FBEOM_12020 [Fusarium beomiforme]|uniref:Uncharacterized protein n=1 Tax=Fusarium beomiforme TaxID=44412 RepID=A0A9P5A8D6_9HYPO|nr:hypothetical protein FBEOM_12020 [Fusarium beomiforme]
MTIQTSRQFSDTRRSSVLDFSNPFFRMSISRGYSCGRICLDLANRPPNRLNYLNSASFVFRGDLNDTGFKISDDGSKTPTGSLFPKMNPTVKRVSLDLVHCLSKGLCDIIRALRRGSAIAWDGLVGEVAVGAHNDNGLRIKPLSA